MKSSQSLGYCLRGKIYPRLRICLRKERNFLSSIFINFLSHLQKNRASRDSYFVCPGERSAVKNLKRLGRQCPRKRYQQIVGNVGTYDVQGF